MRDFESVENQLCPKCIETTFSKSLPFNTISTISENKLVFISFFFTIPYYYYFLLHILN